MGSITERMEKVDDESQEETENEEGEDKNDEASGDGEKEKNGEAGGETAMETESKSEDGETVEGGEKEGEDKNEQEAEDEEDPSNLQLAWEMLELAKVVYTKTVETEKTIWRLGGDCVRPTWSLEKSPWRMKITLRQLKTLSCVWLEGSRPSPQTRDASPRPTTSLALHRAST